MVFVDFWMICLPSWVGGRARVNCHLVPNLMHCMCVFMGEMSLMDLTWCGFIEQLYVIACNHLQILLQWTVTVHGRNELDGFDMMGVYRATVCQRLQPSSNSTAVGCDCSWEKWAWWIWHDAGLSSNCMSTPATIFKFYCSGLWLFMGGMSLMDLTWWGFIEQLYVNACNRIQNVVVDQLFLATEVNCIVFGLLWIIWHVS